MTREEIEDFAVQADASEAIIPDDLDDAFIGFTTSDEEPARAVYSVERCIQILAGSMSHEEATEHFWYNVAGTFGENFPIYITTPED